VTSIRIDQDILREAKDLGLSVSKISENALKEAIIKLQTPKTETNGGTAFLSEGSFGKESSWCGRRDLNPGGRLGKPKS